MLLARVIDSKLIENIFGEVIDSNIFGIGLFQGQLFTKEKCRQSEVVISRKKLQFTDLMTNFLFFLCFIVSEQHW